MSLIEHGFALQLFFAQLLCKFESVLKSLYLLLIEIVKVSFYELERVLVEILLMLMLFA
jgi:hypothetical protein